MKQKKYQVLFGGENVWTINNEPHIFDSWKEAKAELQEHFADMDEAYVYYEMTDYRIEEIVK
jgi:hypothetical protein